MWTLAAWGAFAQAALPISVGAASKASPLEWYSTEVAVPQPSAVSVRDAYVPVRGRQRRGTLLSSVLLLLSCTALIFLISGCVRSLKDANGSLGRGTLARYLAIGSSGGVCGDGEGDDASGVLAAAEQQLQKLTIPPSVSDKLQPREAETVFQMRLCLLAELEGVTRGKAALKNALREQKKTRDKIIRQALQKDIDRIKANMRARHQTLRSMVYVETQRTRELVMMALYWGEGREISQAAAAALVASRRVRHPLDPVSSTATSDERTAVKRLVRKLLERAAALISGLPSGSRLPPHSVASAKALLETGQEVMDLLHDAGMHKKEKKLKHMCDRLRASLGPSAEEGTTLLPRSSSTSSLSSAFSRLSSPLRRGARHRLLRDPTHRHTIHIESFPRPDPPATNLPRFRLELQKLEKWLQEARRRLSLTNLDEATEDEVKSLQVFVLAGRRQYEKLQDILTEPESDDETSKREALASGMYFLREICFLLYPAWEEQISKTQRGLRYSLELFKEALADISPESAPPPGSPFFQNMMRLRASISSARELVAGLRPFYSSPLVPLSLLAMPVELLDIESRQAEYNLQAAGARAAAAWNAKLPDPTPLAEPEPASPPQQDLQASSAEDPRSAAFQGQLEGPSSSPEAEPSVGSGDSSSLGFPELLEVMTPPTGEAVNVLKALVGAGCSSAEVKALEEKVNASRGTGVP